MTGTVPGTRYAVVVDPLGTGQEYPLVFRDAGLATVAVLSAERPIHHFQDSWHPENAAHVYTFDGDLPGLAEAVRRYQPECAIAGSETGVELADALCELVLPGTGNPPPAAGEPNPRRNKWAMAQAVERAGIPHLRQFCSDDPAEIDRWLKESGLAGSRLVLKPTNSAATDNVHFVAPEEDWRPYFQQILGRENTLELRNDAVLVGEFAEGTEYLIDSFSVDGRHGLVDVCRYVKSKRGDRLGIYDLVEFLPPDHPAIAQAWPYTQRVLDAVGVRNGCAHSEVVLTPDGPRFLETGARPAGGGHQMITKLATGSNHLLRTVDYWARGEFHQTYRLEQYVCSVVINSPATGVWRNPELFDEADSLPGFWRKHFEGRNGDPVPASVDFITIMGWVVLAATDHDVITSGFQRLKELERQIEIEPLPEAELSHH